MKNKILIFSFMFILYSISLFSILETDRKILLTERRKANSFPIEFNEDYFKDLDNYIVDQFPFRDNFRKLKASVTFNIYNKLDNNNIFLSNNHIFEINKDISYKSIDNYIDIVNHIKNKYLVNNNIYYSVIPNKNYYLNNKDYPGIKYNDFFNYLHTNMNNYINYIDITNSIDLDSFYYTDIHLRQDKIDGLVESLITGMNQKYITSKKEIFDHYPFYGVLSSKSALNVEGDVLYYLNNSILDSMIIFDYEKNKEIPFYNKSELTSMDSYNVFTGGPTNLIKIDNPNSSTDKELIIFRDSFTSNISPLMIESYKSITLIDVRYISSNSLEKKVDFNNKDILFLHSLDLINNSFTMKK